MKYVSRSDRSTWPKPTVEQPPLEELMEQEMFGAVETTDGCEVEPDGMCPHGHPSWLLVLGVL